jgi:hypothetical protein
MLWNRQRKNEDQFDGVGTLAVIIPALNEEQNIARAIRSALDDGSQGERRRDEGKKSGKRDRNRNQPIVVVVVDGGSSDATVAAARRAGATRVLRSPTRGRGAQLAAGVAAVGVGRAGGSSSWRSSSSSSDSSFLPAPRSIKEKKKPDTLLFLHADSRLPPNYRDSLSRALSSSSSCPSLWGAFESVYPSGLWPISSCFLSACVALRTRLWGLPYGDQAIFVKTSLLERIGGVRPLPLMEDVDLVERLSSSPPSSRGGGEGGKEGGNRSRFSTRPAIARGRVETSGRRWAEKGIMKTTLLNLWTLARWKSGKASAEELALEYYRRR